MDYDIEKDEYMKDWKEVRLGDVVDLISEKIVTDSLNKTNYISTENMIENFGGVTLSSNIPSNTRINSFKKNDLLFSNIRTYFKKLWFANFDGGCSADVLVFRKNDIDICEKYLYYVLKDNKFIDYTVATSKGTKMPRGDKSAILNYNFTLPPLPTQQKIAKILSSLDDKIELNNAINKNLEEIAQTLFKQWFVDFEFPASLASPLSQGGDREGDGYKSSGGEMVESELGLIPKGWRVGKLEDLIDFIIDNRGKTPPVVDMMEKCKYPLVEVNAVTGNSRVVNLSSIKKYVSEATYSSWFRKGHPQKGDVLISTVGTIGQLALIWDEQISIAQNLIAIRGKYD